MVSRYSITVKGRVQGVGFRFFANSHAIICGLTGWVKNLDDGSVAMEVQGPASKIDAFLQTIQEGNRFIRVDSIEHEKLTARLGEHSFRIIN